MSKLLENTVDSSAAAELIFGDLSGHPDKDFLVQYAAALASGDPADIERFCERICTHTGGISSSSIPIRNIASEALSVTLKAGPRAISE